MRKEASYDLPKLTAASAAHQYQRTEGKRAEPAHLVGSTASEATWEHREVRRRRPAHRQYAPVAQNILRQYGVERPPATPLVEYSRYVLRNGSEMEKTAFANGITNKIAVKNSELKLV